jgi:hypothetical protein
VVLRALHHVLREVTAHGRILDLRTGVLSQRMEWTSPNAARSASHLRLKSRVFKSRRMRG